MRRKRDYPIQLKLPLVLPTTDIQQWKGENGYTVERVAQLLSVSRSHAWNALSGKTTLMQTGRTRFEHIKRMQEIIAGNPADKLLLEYELEEYIDDGACY